MGIVTKTISNAFDFYTNLIPLLTSISLVISGVLLFFVIQHVIKINLIKDKIDEYADKYASFKGIDMAKRSLLKSLNKSRKTAKSGKESALKKAIQEYDKLLDEILKIEGYKGKGSVERLNSLTSEQLPGLTEIKEACNICARIKNEPDFIISREEARDIITTYEKTLKNLKFLN